MNVFIEAVESNQDCDFVQALINNFLKNHYDIILEDPDLGALLSQLKTSLQAKFSKLEHLINGNLCMTQYFAGLNNF